jgi:anaphase-promoting complex subunit 6
MAAYRTAHRLFPGLHAPLMGMGQEYQRMNNLGLAEQCFSQVGDAGPGAGVGARSPGAQSLLPSTQTPEDTPPAPPPQRKQSHSVALTAPCPQAGKLCPSDPLVANELGVLAYRNRQYAVAADWLRAALALVPGGRPTPSAPCAPRRAAPRPVLPAGSVATPRRAVLGSHVLLPAAG